MSVIGCGVGLGLGERLVRGGVGEMLEAVHLVSRKLDGEGSQAFLRPTD